MIVATVHHMAGSLGTLISIKGQHHLEITRTHIVINTHFPLPNVDLLFSKTQKIFGYIKNRYDSKKYAYPTEL